MVLKEGKVVLYHNVKTSDWKWYHVNSLDRMEMYWNVLVWMVVMALKGGT